MAITNSLWYCLKKFLFVCRCLYALIGTSPWQFLRSVSFQVKQGIWCHNQFSVSQNARNRDTLRAKPRNKTWFEDNRQYFSCKWIQAHASLVWISIWASHAKYEDLLTFQMRIIYIWNYDRILVGRRVCLVQQYEKQVTATPWIPDGLASLGCIKDIYDDLWSLMSQLHRRTQFFRKCIPSQGAAREFYEKVDRHIWGGAGSQQSEVQLMNVDRNYCIIKVSRGRNKDFKP
jgi:hypothetical protein